MHDVILEVTERIKARSAETRSLYLKRIAEAHTAQHSARETMGCSNLAHVFAAESDEDKETLIGTKTPHIGIITAYNDMLSAHQPFSTYPARIKRALMDVGATAQVAGGVPAMCDGVTQSQPGMELSLFSRDNIAMGAAIGLSHNVYDGALYLGVCDKIVPGLLIGALSFGHLPAIFVPAGPMPSGISNSEKAMVRQEYARGKVSKDVLLRTEAASYHSQGTCTFYGTANSNQMLMEVMGLHIPGSAFINTNTPLRDLLTEAAAQRVTELTQLGDNYMPVGQMIDERSFVNAIIGLMATGGSTNHTIHLIAMAKAAGIKITWDDFDALSAVTPLMCKMYPNGQADVNHFRDAGGMGLVIRELLDAGLLHGDVQTVMGPGLDHYEKTPVVREGKLAFDEAPMRSLDKNVISSIEEPFSHEGGLALLEGNLGRGVIKISALKEEMMHIEAEVRVFETQEALQSAFKAGELEHDFIAVIRFQGPSANGMPELHGLNAPLGALQDAGYKVAIVTDGRMSGASGKVPSAIHITPEAAHGGLLAKVRDGDMMLMDVHEKRLELLVDEAELAAREPAHPNRAHNSFGVGRELFAIMRDNVGSAEEGASIFDTVGEERA